MQRPQEKIPGRESGPQAKPRSGGAVHYPCADFAGGLLARDSFATGRFWSAARPGRCPALDVYSQLHSSIGSCRRDCRIRKGALDFP